MKTLANCTPLEFLTQTNKIRKKASDWLAMTRVLEIRKNVPDIDMNASAAEKAAAWNDQVRKNLSEMLDAVLDKYPNETAELLCLICFIDPKDMEKHNMVEILNSINEILANEEIISFFASLARLGLMNTSEPAKK